MSSIIFLQNLLPHLSKHPPHPAGFSTVSLGSSSSSFFCFWHFPLLPYKLSCFLPFL
jgi:hypothetical protein